jgi:glycosyltransferase involved in cell wall biosynthesis
MTPKISVIMPVFNAASYVLAAIHSILNQTYSNFEFIIIDDASTDQTKALLDTVRNNRIIRIENQCNEGNYSSRNKGIETARGKYICVMDGDDMAHPDRFRIQYQFMELYPDYMAAGSDVHFFSETSIADLKRLRNPNHLQVMLLKDNVCTHPSLIIRRDVFFKHNLRYNENYRYAADYDLMAEISKIGKITNINQFLLFYRVHAQQISFAKREEQIRFADQIRLKQLIRFSIDPSPKEKELHLKLMKNIPLEGDETAMAEYWLNRLLSQNIQLKRYHLFFLYDFFKAQTAYLENSGINIRLIAPETKNSVSSIVQEEIEFPKKLFTPVSSLVSIVMPVHHIQPDELRTSIDSILSQTFSHFELLIIDNASADQCTEVIAEYGDHRIRSIKSHLHFIDALNQGFSEANGKYVVRMDAGDVLLPDGLQTQYDFMECHPETDVCGSWAEVLGEGVDTKQLHSDHLSIISSLLLSNVFIHSPVMMRKKSLQEPLYSKDCPCAEDYKLWTEMARKGFRFAGISEVLVRCRIDKNQVTDTRRQEKIASTRKIQLEYMEWVMEQMVEKNETYETVLNPLIELCNERLISWESLKQIVYRIYSDFLRNR